MQSFRNRIRQNKQLAYQFIMATDMLLLFWLLFIISIPQKAFIFFGSIVLLGGVIVFVSYYFWPIQIEKNKKSTFFKNNRLFFFFGLVASALIIDMMITRKHNFIISISQTILFLLLALEQLLGHKIKDPYNIIVKLVMILSLAILFILDFILTKYH